MDVYFARLNIGSYSLLLEGKHMWRRTKRPITFCLLKKALLGSQDKVSWKLLEEGGRIRKLFAPKSIAGVVQSGSPFCFLFRLSHFHLKYDFMIGMGRFILNVSIYQWIYLRISLMPFVPEENMPVIGREYVPSLAFYIVL